MLDIFSCVFGHLYVFGEMSVEIFCPFFDGVVLFFGIELQKVFINCGDESYFLRSKGQRRHTDGQKTHEKMLSLTNY